MHRHESRKLNAGFFKIWSSKMAYVLGFFAADGNLTVNPRGSHYIEFNSCDRESIEAIKNSINSSHKIAERTRKSIWKPSYRIQLGSKEMFKDLIKLGMKLRKSNDLNFPNVPIIYLADFIRGYFDGDGCVHLGKYERNDRPNPSWVFSTRFTSGSKNFLKGLRQSLSGVTHGGSLYHKIRGFDLAFSTNDSLALFKFMYNNSESGLFLKRKRGVFQRAFKILHMRA